MNMRQFWLLVDRGYEDIEPQEERDKRRPVHDGPPRFPKPEWL